jgi:hypothetical protein
MGLCWLEERIEDGRSQFGPGSAEPWPSPRKGQESRGEPESVMVMHDNKPSVVMLAASE